MKTLNVFKVKRECQCIRCESEAELYTRHDHIMETLRGLGLKVKEWDDMRTLLDTLAEARRLEAE